MTTAKDMLGNEIKPGDKIAYALTAGRSACIAVYEVLSIELSPHPWKSGEFASTIKAQKLRSSYGLRSGPAAKPSTIGMAEERALVITGHKSLEKL